MAEVFVISDTHLGHDNILKFEHEGKPLRPFKNMTEMHVTIIENWNRIVTPKDKVYHLGDVAFTREGLHLLKMMNGKKRLVRGNHDLFKTRLYLDYFYEIYGVRQINGIWLTHVPMAEYSLSKAKVNIHGHLHANVIDDPRYFNVSVERINYTPISIDEVPLP